MGLIRVLECPKFFSLNFPSPPTHCERHLPAKDVRLTLISFQSHFRIPLLAATLKIVFVMIKGLGNQMEQASGQDTGSRLIVNSNLVSFSFVADTRAIKVEMPEPVELLFKHNFQEQQKNLLAEDMRWPQAQRPKSPSCVYWDNALR